jgi:hypothetical protein
MALPFKTFPPTNRPSLRQAQFVFFPASPAPPLSLPPLISGLSQCFSAFLLIPSSFHEAVTQTLLSSSSSSSKFVLKSPPSLSSPRRWRPSTSSSLPNPSPAPKAPPFHLPIFRFQSFLKHLGSGGGGGFAYITKII